MNYAFIILIAVYLVAYGCSPDKSDENSTGHEKSVQTTGIEQQHQDTTTEEKPATANHPVQMEKEATEPQAEQAEEASVKTDEQQAAIMPCERTQSKEEMALQTPPPCAQAMDRASRFCKAADVSAALQNLGDATNEMVMVTRQLVVATQEMIAAIENAAPETAEEQPQN